MTNETAANKGRYINRYPKDMLITIRLLLRYLYPVLNLTCLCYPV